MSGFWRYTLHRLLFQALFGRGSRVHPDTHTAIAIPKLVNVIAGPTDNHNLYYAKVAIRLHGQEVTIQTIGPTRQAALDRLSRALLLERGT